MSRLITLDCTCGIRMNTTPGSGWAQMFNAAHFGHGGTVRVLGGEGYPVVRRFVIRRHKLENNARHPWVLRDRSRPAYLGHYETHELALAAVYRKVRQEKNLPSIDEIKAAMRPERPADDQMQTAAELAR